MDMKKTALSAGAVILGGALGAVSRLLLLEIAGQAVRELGAHRIILPLFPIDIVNIAGCLAAGLIMGLSIKNAQVKSLIVTGFLGAFTSFSAYVQSYAMVYVDGGSRLVSILFVSNALLCLMSCSIGLAIGNIIRGRRGKRQKAADRGGRAAGGSAAGNTKEENS